MRMSEGRSERLASAIVDMLAERDDVRLQSDDAALLHAVKASMNDELGAEDRIDAEVRDLLEQYRNDIAAGRLDYHELFRKIKTRLVNERKVVL
jgi:hypothetical protein